MCKAHPKIPQLWILCSSLQPEPKPCRPRAEPGSCFNCWCPGGWGGSIRRLVVTHSPPCPPVVMGVGDMAPNPAGWRPHCPQPPLHRTLLMGAAYTGTAPAPRLPQAHGRPAEHRHRSCQGRYQLLTPGTCCDASAAAVSDPLPLVDLSTQFPTIEQFGLEGPSKVI